MDTNEKERLIKEKEDEIKRLKWELRELRTPRTLYNLTDHKIFSEMQVRLDGSVTFKENVLPYTWEYIKELSYSIFLSPKEEKNMVKYRPGRKMMKDMTHDERELCARLCDEVIQIYNKYQALANEYVSTPTGCDIKWEYKSEKEKQDDF